MLIPTSSDSRILAIFHAGACYPLLEAWASTGSGGLKAFVKKIANHVYFQRRLRSFAYLASLARESFPGLDDILQVGPERQISAESLQKYTTIVLLWPDANGCGWGKIESAVVRTAPAGTRLWVLNGRRRKFEVGGSVYRKLRWRRILEKSLLPNLLFSLLFFLLAPCLWLLDLFRGRR